MTACQSFGLYLRSLRNARRMTLEDVERFTRNAPEPVTRSLLSRLENGKARISAIKLLALAEAYGVRAETLSERLESSLSHPRGLGLVARPGPAPEDEAASASEWGVGGTADARPRLGEAAELVREGRFRAARGLLEQIPFEELGRIERVEACTLLAESSLRLHQLVVARGSLAAASSEAGGLPQELAARIASLRAAISERLDDPTTTLDLWIAGLERARACGSGPAEIVAMLGLARATRRAGRPRDALFWSRKGMRLADVASDRPLAIGARVEVGRAHRARRRVDLARSVWSEARERARREGEESLLFEVYFELWSLARDERDRNGARAALRSLRHLSRRLETWPVAASSGRRELEHALGAHRPSVPAEARVRRSRSRDLAIARK